MLSSPATATTVPYPELGALIAGEVSYVGGTHVWTDYAYDDRGPDSDPTPGGDAAYASGPGNTADLIQLQLGTRKGALTVGAVLESLVPGTDALIGVGFDTDRNGATGAAGIPGGQWTTQGPLGLDRMVMLGTDGRGSLLAWRGDAWVSAGAFTVDVLRANNLVSATVPGLRPGKVSWRAVGVAGRLENGKSWRTGDLPVQDLAYVRGEDPPNQVLLSVPASLPPAALQPFQDHRQSAILAGNRSSAGAVATVSFGTTRTQAAPVRQGYNAFLYHSRVPVPEGVAADPRVFNGIYQPYGVWVPKNLPERPPMVMFLHGADQYQTVNVAYFSNPASIGIPSPYDVPAVVIFPNGRTPNWGTPVADRDALDAMEDAIRRFDVNRRRVVVSGVSSGGYGTFHLASRYPDLFTGAYSLVGGTGLGGGNVAAVENLTNVPFRASNGLADPLVNVRVWRASADALAAARTVDYRIVLVHNRSHDGPLAEGNCYLLDLLSRNSVRNPGRVRFRVPAVQKEYVDLDLQPTGAYWVQGILGRVAGRSAYVDAKSRARAQRRVVDPAISEIGENASHGADFCGDNSSMQNGNNWEIEGRSYKVGDTKLHNRITIRLTNVASASIDLERAGLNLNRAIRLRIISDGPGQLFLGDDTLLRVREGRQHLVLKP